MRPRHVDEAAAAREVLDPADCRLVVLILLLGRNGVVPNGAVGEVELQVVADMEARPVRSRTAHLHLHGAVGEALPVGAVFHKEVDGAELPRRHAVAACIGIVADPVRLLRRETDGDAPLRTHAAVRDDVALKDGTILPGTVGKPVRTFRNVEVDRTIVVRCELAIGANRRPRAACCADGAAANVDARGYGADALVCSLAVRIGAVREDVDKTVNRDVRLNARCSIHRLDDGRAGFLLAGRAQREHLVLEIVSAVPDMDGAAAVDIEGGGVEAARIRPSDGNGTGVLHIDPAVLADRGDADDRSIALCFDRQFLAFEVNVKRLCGIDIRDRRGCRGCPWSAVHILRIICTDRCIFREDVRAVRLADAGICIEDVMYLIACDGCGEIRLHLFARRRDEGRIDIASSSRRRIERNVLKTFAHSRRRQTFGNLYLSCEIALICRIACILELAGKGVERLAHKVLLVEGCRRLCIET